MCCPNCSFHEAEVKRLQQVIDRMKENAAGIPIRRRDQLEEHYKFTPYESAIVRMLWAAKGNCILAGEILRRLDSKTTWDTVSVHVFHIRKKLGPYTVQNKHGKGYYLTQKGLDLLAPLLKEDA
jgi:DNA-binding response OmpR family regulator